MVKWQEVAIHVHHESQDAVCELLTEFGAGGVSIDDPSLITEAKEARWGDYFPEEQEWDQHVVIKTYFTEHKSEQDLVSIRKRIDQLADYGLAVGNVQVTTTLVDESDWAHAWKEYYHTDRIGNVVIQPSWEEYQPHQHDVIVKLDPGMAFGTGGHPSTAMCIELLQELDLAGKVAWDVGTGSGILAIVASKLGATQVEAVDLDPVALRVSHENCVRNDVDVHISQGSLEKLSGQADVIVANIIADVIIELIPDIPNKLCPEGSFLASGIIDSRAQDVRQAAAQWDLELISERTSGEWYAFQFRRKE